MSSKTFQELLDFFQNLKKGEKITLVNGNMEIFFEKLASSESSPTRFKVVGRITKDGIPLGFPLERNQVWTKVNKDDSN